MGKSDLGDKRVPFDPCSLETYKLYYENLIPDGLHPHPDFDGGSYEQDIMIVKVFGKSRYPPHEDRRRGGKQSRVATQQDGTHHQQQGEGPGDRRVTATTERRGDKRSYSAERRGRGGTAAPRGWAYPFAAARLLLGAAICVRAHNLLPIERGRRRVPFLRPLRFVIRDRRVFCHSRLHRFRHGIAGGAKGG